MPLALDLVLTFSDPQADRVATLIRVGIAVHAFNQRVIAVNLDMIRMLGAMVGADDKTEALAIGSEHPRRPHRRNQVAADPAARSRGLDRSARCDPPRPGGSKDLTNGRASTVSAARPRLDPRQQSG